jgi:hypothetical protein
MVEASLYLAESTGESSVGGCLDQHTLAGVSRRDILQITGGKRLKTGGPDHVHAHSKPRPKVMAANFPKSYATLAR